MTEHERRQAEQDRRREERRHRQQLEPMGDDAAEAALLFLTNTAAEAGKARADVTYMEAYVKIALANIKKASLARSDAAQETDARAHPDYLAAVQAHSDAVATYEQLYWKRIAAVATIDAWRTKNANMRDAGRMQ